MASTYSTGSNFVAAREEARSHLVASTNVQPDKPRGPYRYGVSAQAHILLSTDLTDLQKDIAVPAATRPKFQLEADLYLRLSVLEFPLLRDQKEKARELKRERDALPAEADQQHLVPCYNRYLAKLDENSGDIEEKMQREVLTLQGQHAAGMREAASLAVSHQFANATSSADIAVRVATLEQEAVAGGYSAVPAAMATLTSGIADLRLKAEPLSRAETLTSLLIRVSDTVATLEVGPPEDQTALTELITDLTNALNVPPNTDTPENRQKAENVRRSFVRLQICWARAVLLNADVNDFAAQRDTASARLNGILGAQPPPLQKLIRDFIHCEIPYLGAKGLLDRSIENDALTVQLTTQISGELTAVRQLPVYRTLPRGEKDLRTKITELEREVEARRRELAP